MRRNRGRYRTALRSDRHRAPFLRQYQSDSRNSINVATWFARLGIALSAAVLGNSATERLADAGVFAGTAYDAHHESVGVVATLALLALVALAATLCGSTRTALHVLMKRSPFPIAGEFVLTAAMTFAVILCMEGYETHFGGLSPFDPRTILMHDAPATIVMYLAVFAAVRSFVGAFVRTAAHVRLFFSRSTFVRRRTSVAVALHRCCSKPAVARAVTAEERGGELRAPPLALASIH